MKDMRELDPASLRPIVERHDRPVLFATVSGAHLYGFPSRDSDVDLRGVHVLPLPEVVGLRPGPETIDRSWDEDGMEVDLVTHDAAKFLRLLLTRNGYVLEQLLSPLVVTTGPEREELVALAPRLITRHHAHHYRGFARGQWDLHRRSGELKPLLYTFRVLLTGIHLLRTGELDADLRTVAESVADAPPYLGELIAVKGEQEHGPPPASVPAETVERDVTALQRRLDDAERDSPLPERPTAHDPLHDLLVRIRTAAR